MIVYDLVCRDDGHVFEAWFPSSSAYQDQQSQGFVVCPMCGGASVEKAVMAPNVGAKGNQQIARPSEPRDTDTPAPLPSAAPAPAKAPVPMGNTPDVLPAEAVSAMREMVGKLAKAQAEALKSSTYVGRDFANTARAMHYGEEDHAPIHGEASPQEAEALEEEGVAVAPLPLPIVPPEAKN